MISPVKIWRRQKEIRKILGKKGKILTRTKIYVAGAGFKKQAPYFVVLVEFADRTRAFGQLIDDNSSKLKIGDQVEATLRKVREATPEGVIAYGIKFRSINTLK